jgi:hypothetical protein
VLQESASNKRDVGLTTRSQINASERPVNIFVEARDNDVSQVHIDFMHPANTANPLAIYYWQIQLHRQPTINATGRSARINESTNTFYSEVRQTLITSLAILIKADVDKQRRPVLDKHPLSSTGSAINESAQHYRHGRDDTSLMQEALPAGHQFGELSKGRAQTFGQPLLQRFRTCQTSR